MMTQHLSPEQAARAEALRTAAYILARPKALGSFSTTPPNVVEPVDVHSLAEYILNGGDPWVPTNASGPVPSMT